jgi:exonuclease SbcC
MILKKLRLGNFRRFENLEIRFTDGIIGIVGRNGAGKSTILEAVLWCLYGNKAARTGKDDIKRQNAGEKDVCSVELEFELGGHAYCLTRKISGKSNKTDTSLTRQGELDAVTTKEVDQYIVQLIGLNLKGFLSSFFARQKELNALSEARPAERRNHLAKMLGVGRLDNAIENLKADIRVTREKIKSLENVQIDPQEAKSNLIHKKESLETLLKEDSSVQADLVELKSKFQKISDEIKLYQKAEASFNRLEKKKASIEASRDSLLGEKRDTERRQEDLEQAVSQLPELEKSIAGLDKLKNQVDDLRQAKARWDEKNHLTNDLDEANTKEVSNNKRRSELSQKTIELSENKKKFGDPESEIRELEKKQDQFREKYLDKSQKLAALESELQKLKTQKEQINKLGSDAVCELCLRPFGDDFSQIETHFKQEMLSLNEKVRPIKSNLEELKSAGTELKAKIGLARKEKSELEDISRLLAAADAEFKGIEQIITENTSTRKKIEERLSEIGQVEFSPEILIQKEDELKKLQEERDLYLSLCEKAKQRDEILLNINRLEKQLLLNKSREEEIKSEFEKLNYDPETYLKIQEEVELRRNAIGKAELNLERLKGDIRLVKSEIKTIESQLKQYQKIKSEISDLREKLTYQEKLNLLFAEFRVYLIGRIRPALSARTSQLFNEMTDGRYQQIELDENYNLCLFDRNESFSIDRFSGGEIDLANLCFRLAISVEMAETAGIDQSFIILDEIFGSQDSVRQELIVNGLAKLKNRFRQIIIVSHIEEVKELAEYIIEVEAKDSGLSHVSVVGGL